MADILARVGAGLDINAFTTRSPTDIWGRCVSGFDLVAQPDTGPVAQPVVSGGGSTLTGNAVASPIVATAIAAVSKANSVDAVSGLAAVAVTPISRAKSSDTAASLIVSAPAATDKAKSNATAPTLAIAAVAATDKAKSSDTAPGLTFAAPSAASNGSVSVTAPSIVTSPVTARNKVATSGFAALALAAASPKSLAKSSDIVSALAVSPVSAGSRVKSPAISATSTIAAVTAAGAAVNPQTGNASSGVATLSAADVTGNAVATPIVSNSNGINGAGGGIAFLVPLGGAGSGWAATASVGIEIAPAVGVSRRTVKAKARRIEPQERHLASAPSSPAPVIELPRIVADAVATSAAITQATAVVIASSAPVALAACKSTARVDTSRITTDFAPRGVATHLPERSPARLKRLDELAARRLDARASRVDHLKNRKAA